jgi:hypothetical protein
VWRRNGVPARLNFAFTPSDEYLTMAKNWIYNAIKHPGALTARAKAAGMSVSAYGNVVDHRVRVPVP